MTANRDMLIGTLFSGRYEIKELLGSGSFGNVYLANDKKLPRKVALKILKPANDSRSSGDDGFGWGAVESFVLEARLVANLRSSNTVTLYDYDHFENEDGTLVVYMVLEYVPGLDLNRLIQKRGALGPRMTMNIAVQLLKSLAEAHEGTYGDIVEGTPSKSRQPILHRDIKPGNIMVRLDEEDEVIVKVLDFGMSKLLEAPKTVRTMLGEATGTPGYQSPEQRNRKMDLTPASDLFGVGVVMWQCLSGERCPPSRFLVDEDLPIGDDLCVGAPALKEIIERLLRFAPNRRYQKAEEVINDINHLKIHKTNAAIFSTELAKAISDNDIAETKTLRFLSEHSRYSSKDTTTEDDFKTARVNYIGMDKTTSKIAEESSGEFKIDLVAERSSSTPAVEEKSRLVVFVFIGIGLFALGAMAIGKILPSEPPVDPAPIVKRGLESKSAPVVKKIGLMKIDSQEEKNVRVEKTIGVPSKKIKKVKYTSKKKKVPKQVSAKVTEVLKKKQPAKSKIEVIKEAKVVTQKPEKKVVPKVEKTKDVPEPRKIRTLEDYGM